MMTTEIKVTGMSCQHCVSAVTRALGSVPGATGVQVDLATGLARVEGEADAEALIRALADAGYGAQIL
jgi:copper chaperone